MSAIRILAAHVSFMRLPLLERPPPHLVLHFFTRRQDNALVCLGVLAGTGRETDEVVCETLAVSSRSRETIFNPRSKLSPQNKAISYRSVFAASVFVFR